MESVCFHIDSVYVWVCVLWVCSCIHFYVKDIYHSLAANHLGFRDRSTHYPGTYF